MPVAIPAWKQAPSIEHPGERASSIVDEHDTRLLEAPGSRLTLVTCHPLDTPVPGGPLPYVVQAERL